MSIIKAFLLERLSRYFSYYKAGAFLIISLGLTIYLALKIFELLVLPVRAFSDSGTIIVLFLFSAPPILGYLLSRNFSRLNVFLRPLCAKFPKIANTIELLNVGDIGEREYPEVELELDINDVKIGIIGFVVLEFAKYDQTWCRVAVPTYFFAGTGNFIAVPKWRLRYTGRSVKDTVLTCLRFGTV